MTLVTNIHSFKSKGEAYEKNSDFILVLAMAVVISGGVISTSRVVNAATDINFGSRTVDAGCARRWFPKGQTGYTLTNGQNQTISVTVSTRGNNIGIGFMKYSTKTNYSYYSGVLSGTSVTKKKALKWSYCKLSAVC
mgnify:CR=1 FL=1